jgi:cold shock CspA family protein
MEPSPAVEARIRDKVADLERFYDGITSCHVTVEPSQLRHQKGNLYGVRIDLHVPGKEIVAGHNGPMDHAHEDVYVAIRDTFAAAVRQLEDYARQRRHAVKTHQAPGHGKVGKLFSYEGFGFIDMSDGSEVYFHRNAVQGRGFESIEIGDEVRVVVAAGEGEHGPQASAVIPVGKHHILATAKPRVR